MGVCHRDLKLENVMVDPTTGLLKIIDFGFSRFISSALVTAVGTSHYMAPELFAWPPQQYDGEAVDVDVWAIGVMLYVMLVGNVPFEGIHQRRDVDTYVAGVFRIQGAPLFDGARAILSRIFTPTAPDRIRLPGIIADAWVREGQGGGPGATLPAPPAPPPHVHTYVYAEFAWPAARLATGPTAVLPSESHAWASDEEDELSDEMID